MSRLQSEGVAMTPGVFAAIQATKDLTEEAID